MDTNGDTLINIVVSAQGVDKVQIFGEEERQKKALQLYEAISGKIKALDRAVKAEVKIGKV